MEVGVFVAVAEWWRCSRWQTANGVRRDDGNSRADCATSIGWPCVGSTMIGWATSQQARQDLAPCARRDVRVCAGMAAADGGIIGRERAAAV